MSQYGPPEHPYGQPQLPPQQPPYSQQYAPQQQPPQYQPQPRTQTLAIIALVVGVVALVAALWVVSRGFAPFIGLAALILGIVALVNKRQGGKALAAGGLALGMVSIPLAIILWVVAAGQEVANNKQVQQMSDCIENQPDDILACSGLD
jgi:hypothetical protein